MRLSGWQRLGIVLSVLWLAGVFGYAFWHHKNEQQTYPRNVLAVCFEYIAPKGGDCQDLYEKTRREWQLIPFDWRNPTILGVGPLPFIWLGGWLMLIVIRWVRRGYSPQSN